MTPEERVLATVKQIREEEARGLFRDTELWCEAIRAAVEEERKRVVAVLAESIGMCDYAEGQGPRYPSLDELSAEIGRMQRELRDHDDARVPRGRDSWHEDHGDVLWWTDPITEPPYVGTPLDDDFPEYVTHWTPLPEAFIERGEHVGGGE